MLQVFQIKWKLPCTSVYHLGPKRTLRLRQRLQSTNHLLKNSLEQRTTLVGKENIAYLYSKGVEREHYIVT